MKGVEKIKIKKLVNKLLILDKGKVLDYDNINNLFKKYCGIR